MEKRLRWGIIGAGKIARTFAKHLAKSDTGVLAAVASRDADKAAGFAGEFGPHVRGLGGYEQLLDDAGVDAVYVATPHPQHAEWAVRLLRAGKHVLCEKPLAVNAADAEAVVEEAERGNAILMEAFMYRCHPQTRELVRLLREKAVGDVQFIDAAFSFRGPDDPAGRLLDPMLAGGGILDVGCYPMSIARLVAGVATDRDFAEPLKLHGVGHVGTTGVDEWAAATLLFDGGIVATLRTGVRLSARNGLTIYGTDGRIEIEQPFIIALNGGKGVIRIVRGNDEPREVVVESDKPLYAHEADVFAEAVAAGALQHPAMSPRDTLGNIRALDRWREQVGVTYPFEKPEGYRHTTVAGTPLRRADDAPIPHTRLAGVGVEVSRLVLGCDNQNRFDAAAVLYDTFFEAGGNTFDTGTVYGQGRNRLFGKWLTLRGVRESVAVICKGAHTPECRPEAISRQLDVQFDWLETHYCDIYFLHRDDERVPVGEFVDALDEQVQLGRIRGVFGGSNWSLARVREANTYAQANGRRGFGAVSQNLSLADMVAPVWRGCQSAHDAAWREFLAQHQMPNFAWSSQARGFFIPGRDLNEEELVRCWTSDANLERRRRCFELAERRGVEPVAIAAAWVLRQPFPSFALIGTRTLGELRSSMRALTVTLSDAEHAWLDLAADSPH